MSNEYRDISYFQLSDQYSSRVIHDDQFQVPYKGNLVPSALTFGSIVAGNQSAVAVATLTNMGFRPLSIKEIKSTSDFIFTTDCPIDGELGVGKSCSINVIFNPSNSGMKEGGLYVNTGDAQGSEFISLVGYGVPSGKGNVGLSATALSFGSIEVGKSSTVQQVTLSNTGEQDLTVSSINVSGEFSVVASPAAPHTLVAGTSLTLTVMFTPLSAGAKAGTITLGHNGTGLTSIALSGTGNA